MPEPTLPALSQSILDHKPKLSGECPTGSLALMFGIGLPISIVLGVIAHYLGIVVGFVGAFIAAAPNLLTSLCGFVAVILVIWAIAVVLIVVLGYPTVVGVVTGMIIGRLGKRGKCRNTTAPAWAGGFAGIIVYAVHSAIALLLAGGLHILTVQASMLEDLFDIAVNGTPWWMFIVVAIEAIIVIIASAMMASSTIEESNFCEAHDEWYGPWREGKYPLELAEPIAQSLETGMLQGLDMAEPMAEKVFPYLSIRTRQCPSSPACEIEVAGKLTWQEVSTDKKGKESTKEHSKDWFDTMVPPRLGRDLEAALRLG